MNKKSYYYFLFLSSFGRGLVESFSLVLLYKKGFSISFIFLFLILSYLLGIIISYVSLKSFKKFFLIISNMLYAILYIYFSFMDNSIYFYLIFLLLFSFSNYSYHTIRHYYAMCIKKDDSDFTHYFVLFHYFGVSFSSFLGGFMIEYISVFWVSVIIFLFLLISCIPIIKCKISIMDKESIRLINIGKKKIVFSMLEQFKVVFIELQSLFLYLYIYQSFFSIGIFRVIMNLASLVFALFFIRCIKEKKVKYISLALGIVLIFKLFVKNQMVMFIIAFLEGVFCKMYEVFSLRCLYSYKDYSIGAYLMTEEFIFLLSKSIIVCLFLFLNFKVSMFICVVGIIISGFLYEV